MKLDFVFLIMFMITVCYTISASKPIESMADVTISDQIKQAVKDIYLADVESIRTLANVANKLQAGGFTVPSDLIVAGSIKFLKGNNIAHPDDINTDGSIYRAEGQLHIAVDDCLWFRDSDRKKTTIKMDVFGGSLALDNELKAGGNIFAKNRNLLAEIDALKAEIAAMKTNLIVSGNITVGGSMVASNIAATAAHIGDWDIRTNRIGIVGSADMTLDKNDKWLRLFNYNTGDYAGSSQAHGCKYVNANITGGFAGYNLFAVDMVEANRVHARRQCDGGDNWI